MKKSGYIILFLLLALIGGFFWLLSGTSSKHLSRKDVVVDITNPIGK